MNSRPALRAAACGGRPRAGSHTAVTGAPAPPFTQQKPHAWAQRRAVLEADEVSDLDRLRHRRKPEVVERLSRTRTVMPSSTREGCPLRA